MTQTSILPADLEAVLKIIGERLQSGESVAAELPSAIAGISALAPNSISRAAPAIANAAKLFRWRPETPLFERLFSDRLTDKQQLLQLPDLAYLFLFHFDGRMRELALKRITGGIPTAFLFVAVALRLNDWVGQVRTAAFACAQRCFPLTFADVVADSAQTLLLRQDSWGRWGKERQAVDAAFAREDVAAHLADGLAQAATGPASRLLRMALKHEGMDVHLDRLASSARQPTVRAVAVQSLTERRASWPDGWEYKWQDKSMGLRVRATKFGHRDIRLSIDRLSVVLNAASDKSAAVRKVALDALIRDRSLDGAAQECAQRLENDRSSSVRERAAFLLSRDARAETPRD